MLITRQDRNWARSIGIDMTEPRTADSLKVELNGAYDYITRLEFKLLEAKNGAAKWHRRWVVSMGVLMGLIVVLLAISARLML